MLSRYTIDKLIEKSQAATDIIWYYENCLGYEFSGTAEISQLIDNAFANGYILYNNEISNDNDFIKWFNKRYHKNYSTIKDLKDNENIDLIRGDDIYAIIW